MTEQDPNQGSTGGPDVNPATEDQEAQAAKQPTGQVAPEGEAPADAEAQAQSDQAAQQPQTGGTTEGGDGGAQNA
jgi:hypothetical protein